MTVWIVMTKANHTFVEAYFDEDDAQRAIALIPGDNLIVKPVMVYGKLPLDTLNLLR